MDKVKRTILSSVVFILLIFLVVYFLVPLFQKKYTYFEPTAEFYICDHANALSQGAKWQIYLNSDYLYTTSKTYDVADTIKGSQVVVITYFANEFTNFESTTLFNEWKIGDNDMGILLALSFNQTDSGTEFNDVTVEIGEQMMGYVSAMEENQIITDSFSSYSDYEMQLGQIYYETLSAVYNNVYDVTFTYSMENFQNDILEETDPLPSEETYYGSWLEALFVGVMPLWLKVVLLAGLFMGLTGIIKFGIYSKHSGGGGGSVGYWFKRK